MRNDIRVTNSTAPCCLNANNVFQYVTEIFQYVTVIKKHNFVVRLTPGWVALAAV
jgi:hypothetical protein